MAENGNTKKIELEQVEAEQMPEVYDSQIAACIDEYCRMKKPPIKDMTKEPQNIWNGALMYTKRCLFKDRNILKIKKLLSLVRGVLELVTVMTMIYLIRFWRLMLTCAW